MPETSKPALGEPSPERVADMVADMVRRAVLAEMESSSERNQVRVVVFRPLESDDPDADVRDTYRSKILRCNAVIVNPAKETRPVIASSQQAYVEELLPEGDDRERFLQHLDHRTVMDLMYCLAQKVYGIA